MKPLADLDHYELLEVSRDARIEEIEHAYSLVHAADEEDALAAYSVLDESESSSIRERIEQAYRVLSDPEARHAYDQTLGAPAGAPPLEEPREIEAQEMLAFEPVTEMAPPAEALAHEIEGFEEIETGDADAPWDGARLRRARMMRGVDLEAIAGITKVNPTYLRFVEEERFDDLPAAVYVRGFVTAYARYLGHDGRAVAASYMERFEQHHGEQPRGRLLGRR